jgi:hypothetical protein
MVSTLRKAASCYLCAVKYIGTVPRRFPLADRRRTVVLGLTLQALVHGLLRAAPVVGRGLALSGHRPPVVPGVQDAKNLVNSPCPRPTGHYGATKIGDRGSCISVISPDVQASRARQPDPLFFGQSIVRRQNIFLHSGVKTDEVCSSPCPQWTSQRLQLFTRYRGIAVLVPGHFHEAFTAAPECAGVRDRFIGSGNLWEGRPRFLRY